MVGLEYPWRVFPNSQSYSYSSTLLSPLVSSSLCTKYTPPLPSSSSLRKDLIFLSFSLPNTKRTIINHVVNGSCSIKFALPRSQKSEAIVSEEEEEEEGGGGGGGGGGTGISRVLSRGNLTVILSSCLVGLLTGLGVVLFNNGVHELRDYFWDGIPYRGASWLREEPIEDTWKRVILVPACGGLIVSVLNVLRGVLDDDPEENDGSIEVFGLPLSIFDGFKAASRPFLKAVAACVTLGTGNSLGPEGPSVEIGTSIAKGVDYLFNRSSERKTSIVAAGSAAGIASGFNAAVAGCFFAVESVLWPSPTDPSSLSLSNATSMVILSAVIASVISEVGLGSEPAFKVPVYDFRSPTELPLYLLLGILCGLVSLALSRCTSFMLVIVDKSHKTIGIPRALFPILGGLSVGLIALAYPEILYWGFQNVDILLESRPFVKGLSADLLFQLVAVKIIATSLCRASGLVGGYYAPSLFIGAATGVAYGKLISFVVAQPYPFVHISFLEVASPQAYGLVGMAATLAGVCQVPLTAVLLLFELTQDYRIVLPLLGAVGFSSWITSGQSRRKGAWENKKLNQGITRDLQEPNMVPSSSSGLSSSYDFSAKASNTRDLCEIESSLCVEDSGEKLEQRIYVSEAMKTRYVTIMMNTLLTEALTLMLREKQPCAMIVDNRNVLVGLLTLRDIQEFGSYAKARSRVSKELLVSEMCSMDGEICRVPWVATPSMDLLSAQMIMNMRGLNEVPVVTEHHEDQRGHLVGLLDRECISLTCRAVAARESLS